MNSAFITRLEVKNRIFELLLKNREYSLLPHDRHMEILDDLENVIFLLTENDFCKNKIRENKSKLYDKYYNNNYVYVLHILEGNNDLITDLSKGVCDESILYKKQLDKLVGPKTKEIIIKQQERKNIKIKETYSETLCRYCGSKTVKESVHTHSIDECDVVSRHCVTCDRRY